MSLKDPNLVDGTIGSGSLRDRNLVTGQQNFSGTSTAEAAIAVLGE
jgi:putative intracellular protease/amidase